MTKDKGIRTALGKQPQLRLPSNFTYRTMQRLEEEIRAREARMEKRLYIAMLTTCALMLLALIGTTYWLYGENIRHSFHSALQALPDTTGWTFYLPMLMALPLLWAFNLFLKKKFQR